MDSSFEEGRIEGIKKVALALKKQNIAFNIIAEKTELTRQGIEEL